MSIIHIPSSTIRFTRLATLLVGVFGAPAAMAGVIAFDPFSSTSSSDAAEPSEGFYFSNVNGAEGSLASDTNANAGGGPVIGFGDHPWTSSTSTFRVQLGNLDTDSREDALIPGNRNDGGVRVLTFKGSGGGGSSAVRTLSRQLDPFTAPDTYYLSAVTNVFTAESPGEGGYFYIGFGDSAVDSTGLFEGLQWGYRTNATNDGVDFVLRGRNAAGSAVEEVVVLENVPGYDEADTRSASQFLVLKVEVNPHGADTITYWLDPEYGSDEPGGGAVLTNFNAFESVGNLTHFGAVTSLLRHSGGNSSTNRIGYFDSIALGDSYAAVVSAPGADVDPPEPNPPLWAEGSPVAVSASRVEMTAQPVVGDGYSVEYYFENVDDPGANSGWIDEPEWAQLFLQPATTYSYRFKARDLSPARNETEWSEVRSVTTADEVDTNPPVPNPPLWDVEPEKVADNAVYMRAAPVSDPEGNEPVEYYFANLTDPARDSGWQLSPEFTDADLPYSMEFRYAFKARDSSINRNETGWSVEAVVTTGDLPEGETYWQTFEKDPREEGWVQIGSANSFDFYAEGYLLVRMFRTVEDQRFSVPLSRGYNQDQEFWLEFDWLMESAYEWPRGLLGVMDSASPNAVNIAALYFQRRNLSADTESQRGIVYNDEGGSEFFTTSDYPREAGGIDARTKLRYYVNAVGEGWMEIDLINLSTGEIFASGSGKVLNPGETFRFDSLGFSNLPAASNSPQWFDRIRVDNLYFSTEMPADVYFAGQGVSRPAPSWIGDVNPPEPNPPIWEDEPAALSATRVTMTGQPVVDDQYGVQYYFENIGNPLSNSGWIDEPEWTEVYLLPETAYTYRFKARDLSPNRNETEWSEPRMVVTPPETDTTPPLPNPPEWEAEPSVVGANRVFMRAGAVEDPEGNGPVEYYFANLTDPSRDSGWQTSPEFVDSGLPYESQFRYVFKARDISANRNETDWSSEFTVTTGSAPLLGEFARTDGFWESPRVGENAFYQVLFEAEVTTERRPVIVYMVNTSLPRIGMEDDASIISDFIDEGYIVVLVDFHGNTNARHPDLDWDMWELRRNIVGRAGTSILDGTSILPDTVDLFVLPAGYRLVRNLVYWDIEAHGAFGTLNRIMNTYNGHVVDNHGVEPVSRPEDMRGPDGEEIDYLLRMDIAYPSQATAPVPLVFESSTQSNRLRAYRPEGIRAPYFLGKLTNGWAWAMVDHCYNPLARDYHYGYWDGGYTLEDWNGLASITAAVRFLRAHADQYNLDPERFGGMGHSKGSYTITRLADPDHPNQGEHFTFSGQPTGSPEPQPWPGYSSQIQVSYQSMGNGTRRIQYVTPDNVPTVVACGIFDQYNQWLVFPDLVQTYEMYDLNHLALWMTDLGHTLPANHDPILDRDRYELVFDFFRQYLQPPESVAPRVLYALPRGDYPDLPLTGRNRPIPARELLPEGKEDWVVDEVPLSLFFAPPVNVASANAGGIEVVRLRSGEVLRGEWIGSLGNARLSFIPDTVLPDHEELEIRVTESLLSLEGQPHEGQYEHRIVTGSLSAAYEQWRDSHGLGPEEGGVLDRPSGGEVNNFLAYALDLNPRAPRAADRIESGLVASESGWQLFLEYPPLQPELLYRTELSTDLHDWVPANEELSSLTDGHVRGWVDLQNGWDPVFLRLAVEPR